MWIFWVIGFAVVFLLLAQFISRLPGENFAGLKKVIPDEMPRIDANITDNTIERLSGKELPYFENLLLLEARSPQELLSSGTLNHAFYQEQLNSYHQENVDLDKAMLRMTYIGGGRHIYKDYPIRLADERLTLFVDAPGSTVTVQLGFFTEEHNFIPLMTSNDVVLPQ